MDSLFQNLRYALRTLRHDAGVTAFVIVIAGFGIGASSTVFSVVHALLLRPLPFAEADRLVWISNQDVGGLSGQTTQVGHMLDLQERTQAMSAIAGYFAFYGIGDHVLTGRGQPERLSGVPVSRNFFEVLGVTPELGRTFTAEEATWNGPKAVLLSHGFWRNRFAGDPAVVGTSLTLNGQPHTVAGVLPASFDFAAVFAPGRHFDLYFAFPLSPETHRWGNTMAMIGLLRPGMTPALAQAEIRTLAAQITQENPGRNSFQGFVTPLAEHVTGRLRLALWVLTGAVGLVMLIVCANLSNLLLARMAARQRELAIRSALGAGRGRLVAQLLTEGVVLASAGAVLGLGLAAAGTRALAGLEAINIPLLQSVQTDASAVGFTLAVAIVTGLVFGLAPALQARSLSPHDTLKDATRGTTAGRARGVASRMLVVAEIALACMLLVGAGLLIRSLVRVLEVEMGFDAARAAAIRVDPDRAYESPEQELGYFDEVLRRARVVPGVAAAAITDALPLGSNRTWGVRAKGVTYERGRVPSGFVRVVSEGYPAAMGIRMLSGRDFTEHDTRASERVVIVNETLAQTLWPGEDPIGKIVVNLCAPERRVVGVVGNVRHLALEQASGNEFYLPMRQCGDQGAADLVLRSSVAPASLAGAVRGALAPLAPSIAGNEFRTLQQIVDQSVSPRRFVVTLLVGFALFALVLASLGIYGLISYAVHIRTQEIGIRMALGASAGDVQRGIVRQTLAMAVVGIAIGTAGSWALARAMSGLLFEVGAADPATFAGMLLVLTLVAVVAGYVPARRASRIDPVIALRADG